MNVSSSEFQTHRLALPSGFMLSEYRILEVLGEGSFGITYLGQDIGQNVQVAIKELLPIDLVTCRKDADVILVTCSAKAEFVRAKQRFINEGQTLTRLKYQPRVPYGAFTDIYSLAATIIYAMTGSIPPKAVDRLGDYDPYIPIARGMRGRYSRWLTKAMSSAFAVRPQARLQNVADWRRLLTTRSQSFKLATAKIGAARTVLD